MQTPSRKESKYPTCNEQSNRCDDTCGTSFVSAPAEALGASNRTLRNASQAGLQHETVAKYDGSLTANGLRMSYARIFIGTLAA